MSRFADLVIKEDRTPEEDQELHVLAQQLDYVVADVGATIGPGSVVSYLRAGCVVLDNAGMHTFLGGVETGRIEADGDFLLGSNIAAAATTSFAVFTNAQTYNSESIGAGDLLVGDNTASKANILWDASTGKLLFRGGTTTQGYIDTNGTAVFGGGEVQLSSLGIRINEGAGGANMIVWEAATTADVQMYGNALGTTPNQSSVFAVGAIKETGGTGSSGLQFDWDGAAAGEEGQLLLRGSGPDVQLKLTNQETSSSSGGIINLRWDSTGTVAAGFGGKIYCYLENAGGETELAGITTVAWADVTATSEDSFIQFDVMAAGANTKERLKLGATEVVFNDDREDVDFRIETDDEDNFFFIDGNDNTLHIGDRDTNYTQFAVDGDLTFVGTAGLAYGNMYTNADIAVTATTATWVEMDAAQAWTTGKVHNCT